MMCIFHLPLRVHIRASTLYMALGQDTKWYSIKGRDTDVLLAIQICFHLVWKISIS
jgi:hypothetical protein